MNVHIQDGNVRVFGSDLELATATATDKAVFDRIISAIGSASRISPVADCNTHTDNWEDDEGWEDDEEEDEENGEQDEEEELKEALEEMLGATFEVASLSELAEKLKEIFGQ